MELGGGVCREYAGHGFRPFSCGFGCYGYLLWALQFHETMCWLEDYVGFVEDGETDSEHYEDFLVRCEVSTHRTIMSIYMKKDPRISKDLFVSPSAAVISDVEIRHGSSIWYGSILRGDVNSIHIGSGSNIQDNSLIHVAKTNISGNVLPTIIGSNVPFGVEPITSRNLKV